MLPTHHPTSSIYDTVVLGAYDRAGSAWTGKFRTSLSEIPHSDGAYLVDLLRQQQSAPADYPLNERERVALRSSAVVLSATGEPVPVTVPENSSEDALPFDLQTG
jgi:hypothetical protein